MSEEEPGSIVDNEEDKLVAVVGRVAHVVEIHFQHPPRHEESSRFHGLVFTLGHLFL